MTNYFLYARKSTEDEDRQVLSIEAQLTEMRALAKREGLNIKAEFRESQSAMKPGRPIFNDMMSRIEKGEASGLISWKLDRLARNTEDGGKITEWLVQKKVQHIRVFERGYYPTDNIMLMCIEFAMGKQYSLDLGVNTKRGLREKIRQGWYPALAPVGYLNDKGEKTIIVDKQKSKVIKAAFELYAQGNSRLEDIAKFLCERGVKTNKTKHNKSRGDLPFSKTKTSYILANPFYYGYFIYAGELQDTVTFLVPHIIILCYA